ncbi:MAG: BON domain-containing protein [Gallionella sp.]|nr:BON domain-containing protein [Gallionella sp.]
MITLAKFKLIGMSLLIVGGLTACDKPGPAETAGKKLDQTVNKAGDKIADTADKVGEKVDQQTNKVEVSLNDAEITTKIKAAIFAELGLSTLQISVDTLKGVVTLSGSVDTQRNSDRAKALSAAVLGVQEVKNLLVLKSVK